MVNSSRLAASRLAVAVSLMAVVCLPATAAYLVDDFSTGQGLTTADASVSGAGILGGVREVFISDFKDGASFVVSAGSATFTGIGNGVGESHQLAYDGLADGTSLRPPASPGLGGINLFGTDFFTKVRYEITAITGTVAVTMIIRDAVGGESTTMEFFNQFNAPGIVEDAFEVGPGTPASQAASLLFSITGLDAGESISFGRIGIASPGEEIPTAVPLPAPALLLSGALLALAGLRPVVPPGWRSQKQGAKDADTR